MSVCPVSGTDDATWIDAGGVRQSSAVILPLPFRIAHALREIKQTYGDNVSVKSKSLLKFGENLLVGGDQATIMTLPGGVTEETYVSTNAIDTISSSDGGDDQPVVIEGHTIDGSGNLEFQAQTVTLEGQSKVTLPTPLARVTRIYNAGATNWAGSVYVYEDGAISDGAPTNTSTVHLIGPAAENQSLKASTSISSVDYALITSIYASVNKKTQGGAVIRLRIRNIDGVFRTVYKRGINSLGPDLNYEFDPCLIVPSNSDVIITAEADASSTPIAAGFNSYLANT